MSWYREFALGESWQYRAAVSIDNLSGTAPIDVSFTVPSDWDEFWANVNQTDGRDVRVTGPDGASLETYQLNSFNASTRVLTVDIDNLAQSNSDAVAVAWIYWGNSIAVDQSSAFVPAAAKAGIIELSCPSGNVVIVRPEQAGDTTPSTRIQKSGTEKTYIWFDFAPMMQTRCDPYDQTTLLEEIDYVQVQVLLSGVDQPSLYSEDEVRIVDGHKVRVTVESGISGTDYTLSVTMRTTLGRTLNPRVLLKVQNVSE